MAPPTAPDQDTVELVHRLVSDCVDLPAFAVDGPYDVLAWNDSTTEWYTDFGRLEPPHRNLLWWMFTEPEAGERIVDWRSYAHDPVAGTRFAAGTGRIDPGVEPLLAELRTRSGEFTNWWESHDVLDQERCVLTFQHPRRGGHRLSLLTVRPVVSASISVTFHLPLG